MKYRLCVVVLFLTACTVQQVQPTPTFLSAPIFISLPTKTITSTPISSPTLDLPTLTSVPYQQYSIDYLRTRSYGGSTLDVVQILSQHQKFSTYSVRYQSDGLYIYAIANVPNGDGIYPVVISVHGYIKPEEYRVLDTDFTVENDLADAGYITIHPTMRNYPPSDSGDNLFRVGDTIDVLNLIAIVKSQSGTGILEKADPDRIGLGGRSMGGGIVLRILTINKDVKAAYLYSPTSGDETRNADFFHAFARGDAQFKGESHVPSDVPASTSPQNYYADIVAPILLAHGTNDSVIPDTWSEDTCDRLKEAGVEKRCIFYPRADHTFYRNDLADFISEVLSFFEIHLRQ
jgi:dipeptidyl aminopeptidase/acylaminoacyl peptidase